MVEGMGLAGVKNEADDITMDSFRQSYAPKYIPVAYGKGFQVSREAKDDNQYGLISTKAPSYACTLNECNQRSAHARTA
jgi:hypothetical protein